MTHIKKNKVIWINLQGADWALITPLLQSGDMPNLEGLVAKGSSGQLFAVPPRRYPVTAISLATGTAPQDHMVVAPIVADDSTDLGIRPTDRADWTRAPVWEVAASAGLDVAALGWPATHPANKRSGALILSDAYQLADGKNGADWPFDPACLSDQTLTDHFRDLRFHPQDITAQMLTPLLGATDTIDLKTDERLPHLVEALARTFTLHRAASWIATERPQDLLTVNFDFVDQLSQVFLQYQAPRLGHVTAADHARYKDVVTGAYTYFDQMLAPYIAAADNVVITSDHGYLTGDLRKRPTEQDNGRAHVGYRDLGVYCAAGPAFQKGQQVSGKMTTSVAPTVLAALGVKTTPSDDVKAASTADPHMTQLTLAFLQRRGVLPPLPEDRETTRESVQSTALTRLAQCNIAAQKYDTALAQLEQARSIAPGLPEVHLLTAQCSVAVQDWDKAAKALQTLEQMDADLPMAIFLRGRVAFAKDDPAAAKDQFAKAVAEADDNIEGCRLLESVGTAYLNMQAFQEAANAFAKALRINSSAPRALNGLGSVHLVTKSYDKARACFQASLAILQNQPRTQALRGYALLGLKKPAEARAAFETALSYDPTLDIAQQGLKQAQDQGAAE